MREATIAWLLRDTKAIDEAGLKDLCWAMTRGNVYRGDVVGLVELFEQAIAKAEEGCHNEL